MPIQCLNAALEIGVPFTVATAFEGTLLPHADRPMTAKKTAPSAEMQRKVLVTTASTLAERITAVLNGLLSCLADDREQRVGCLDDAREALLSIFRDAHEHL